MGIGVLIPSTHIKAGHNTVHCNSRVRDADRWVSEAVSQVVQSMSSRFRGRPCLNNNRGDRGEHKEDA